MYQGNGQIEIEWPYTMQSAHDGAIGQPDASAKVENPSGFHGMRAKKKGAKNCRQRCDATRLLGRLALARGALA